MGKVFFGDAGVGVTGLGGGAHRDAAHDKKRSVGLAQDVGNSPPAR